MLLLLCWLHICCCICTRICSHGWLSCSIGHSCSCRRSVLIQPALPLLLLRLPAGGPAAPRSQFLKALQGGLALFRALPLEDSPQLVHQVTFPAPWRGLLWLCWAFRCGALLLFGDALSLYCVRHCWGLLNCMHWQLLELVCICI